MDQGLSVFQNFFPKTVAALQRTLDQGLNLGGQLYVSNHGAAVLDCAFGMASPKARMHESMAIHWFSAGKPITAIAVAQLIEEGEIGLDDTVAMHIPEFAGQGKGSITLRHVLTHTGGFRTADVVPENISWEETIQRICESPLESNWIPGQKAGYSTRAGWFVLAEIVQRKRGCNFESCVNKSIFLPLGMTHSGFVMKAGVSLAPVYIRQGEQMTPALIETSYPRPGSSARGPIRELGWFYESLLKVGGRPQVVGDKLLRQFTDRERVGMFDQTFLHIIDMGFGFIINSNDYGGETVPYGYGRHASPSTFGHSGNQCSCGFADPGNGLVVAWALNQQPGERLHQQRAREINSAIYQDLHIG